MNVLTITSFWIIQAVLSSNDNDFLSTEQNHLVMYVCNIMRQNFRPGASIHVLLPSDAQNTNQRHRYLSKCIHCSSDLDTANILLEKLSEEHRWRVSVSCLNIKGKDVQEQDIYLILISSGQILKENINSTIKNITVTSMLNSKAKFLVVITSRVRGSSEAIAMDALKELWERFKVLNSVIVMPTVDVNMSPEDTGHAPVIDMYTWTPRQSEKQCMELTEVELVDRWYWEVNKNLNNRRNLYANKLPSNFRKCPLKVGTPLRHYHYDTNDKNESILMYDEPEITFLHFVFEKLNFTMILDSPQPRDSDYVKSITNVIMKVVFGDFDLAIGEIPLQHLTTQYADYTVSHYSQRSAWYVPCGRHKSRVATISRIFSVTVWLMILISLFIAGTLMTCMGVYLNRNKVLESRVFMNATVCLFTLWAVTMGVSASELPRTSKLRIFFILFVWYSLAISTVFQTYFTSYLSDPGLKDQIKDFEGLLKSGIEFGYDPFFDELIGDSSDSRYQNARKRRIECTDRNYCLGRVDITGDFAYLDTNAIALIYRISHKDALVCPLDDGVINIRLTMYMKKGNVLIDKMNHVITAVIESGLFRRLERHSYNNLLFSKTENQWFKRTVNKTLVPAEDDERATQDVYVPLSLRHLHIACYFAVAGYTLSFFVLVGEILASKIHL